MRRIDRLEDLLNDLVGSETKGAGQALTMTNLKQQAVQCFDEFDAARQENEADMREQAQSKNNELDELKEQLTNIRQQNEQFKAKIQAQRRLDIEEGNAGYDECQRIAL